MLRTGWPFFACFRHDSGHVQMESYPRNLGASSNNTALIENPNAFLRQSIEAIFRFPDSFPLQVFRCAQRVRWGDLEYVPTWNALFQAGLEAGAPESWVRRELFHGFANSQKFKAEPPHLAALEGGTP